MGTSTFDEAVRPGGTGYVNPVVTLYTLDCPKCRTLSVGDDVYENWKPGEAVSCKKCGHEGVPTRTGRMEIGV